jgi:cysteine desulfurase
LNVEKFGVDLLSFNGSKIYGPKGIGVLYAKRGVMLSPIIFGGGQERGLRSGTLNVAGIVGLASALEICVKEREKESARLFKLQSKLMEELKKIPGLIINGPVVRDRLPNNINFSIKNFEGEQLVIELNAKGFAVSSGSACSSQDPVNNNIRLSLGREADSSQIKSFVRALMEIVHKYEALV